MLLSDKYPFLTNYLNLAIENKLSNKNVPITHSLLFSGSDLESQYILATEIARHLNCLNDRSDECDCLNCKWIREGTHPAVLTISRKDNKPVDDTTKNVISIKQASLVKSSLMTTSDFYRVFIFCDKDENNNIKGLNPLNFQEETANSLLKVIEEPNDKIMFIFLTSNKEDVLATIISRSQCFNVSKPEENNFDYNNVYTIINNYWEIPRQKLFDTAKDLFDLSKTTPITTILEEIQHYILAILKSNPENTSLISDIKNVEIAKKQVVLGMSPQNIIDDLCLKIIK